MSQPFFPGSSVNPDNFLNSVYKPDVLQCLANLSSDEVFTPPDIVNQMLDLLPKSLWSDPEVRFLDPVSKSGVFLREIAKRLIAGLESEIPDLQTRLDHIFHNQLFGIAITELTSLISRRTLYCTKDASSKYSVSKFDSKSGNIFYTKRTKHKWENGKCIYCSASQEEYDREDALESYAYQFIHPGKVFDDMRFDVIVGNPPYHLSDGGAFASASPIYNKFVEQAIKLNPRFLTMIIPARWYAGGKGLDDFRQMMLTGNQIRVLHDFPLASDCFPGIRLSGGCCYFLWDKDHPGNCKVVSHNTNGSQSTMVRPLLEEGAETFIRVNEFIPILRKVRSFNEGSFSELVSGSKPFGMRSDFFNDPAKYNMPPVSERKIAGGYDIVGTYKYKTVHRYVSADYPFTDGFEYMNKYKVFVSNVLDNGFDWTKERLHPFLGGPKDVCTETFLCIGCQNKTMAENIISYMNTKFFHILLFAKKISHHVTAKVYQFVPIQDFSKPWTDEELYAKYGLSDEEIEFIETMIRPMD